MSEQLAMDVAALPDAFTARWHELEAARADHGLEVVPRIIVTPTPSLHVVKGLMWGPLLVGKRRIGIFGEEPAAAAERIFEEVTRG